MNGVAVRRIATIVNGGTPVQDESNWNGDISWATPVDLGRVDGGLLFATDRTITKAGLSTGSGAVPPGSLILSTRAPIGYLARTTELTAFNQGCRGLVPKPEVDVRFLKYALQSCADKLAALGQGSTFAELSTASLASLRLPMASRAHQQKIADFLDRETAEIDGFIADQISLNRLMAERSDALQSSMTIGRVDDRRVAIRHVADIVVGKMLSAVEAGDGDVELPYLRAANVQPRGQLALRDLKTMRFSRAEARRLDLRRDDVVVVEGGVGGYGRAALINQDLPGFAFQNSIVRLRARPGISAPFLTYSLLALRDSGYIKSVASVSSMPHFTAEKIAATMIPLPAIEVQHQVVNELSRERSVITSAIADANRAIELARERRAALISAAVTGKIDVTV